MAGGYPLEENEMPIVDMKVGRNRIKHLEFVVVGEEGPGMKLGEVRWIEWDRSKTSPVLEVTFTDKERTHVSRIMVRPKYAKRGWVLLRDLFADDDEAAPYWDDYVRFAEEQRRNPEGMHGKEFPRRMLPKKLVEMQAKAAVSKAERTEFVFSDGSTLSEGGKPKRKPKTKPEAKPAAEADSAGI